MIRKIFINKKYGSSEIWSDKVSLLHIKGTQRGGEYGGESRQYHGGAEGTKSDRAVVYVLLITLVINVLRNLVNPLLCNEVDKNITRVRDKKRLEKVGNLVKNSYLYR